MYFSKRIRYFFIGVILLMGSNNIANAAETKSAVFAGGCFWCMEPPFQKMPGVISVTSGYAGGQLKDPTYEQVSNGGTGHAEAVKVVYDPTQVTYQQLLDTYWRNIDPTVDKRQFCDVGDQYRSAIFVENSDQKKLAEASKQKLIDSGKFEKVYTEIEESDVFYTAEEYHQDYATKNPIRYNFYRSSCGRDNRLNELWEE